jgi:hypothetical protein
MLTTCLATWTIWMTPRPHRRPWNRPDAKETKKGIVRADDVGGEDADVDAREKAAASSRVPENHAERSPAALNHAAPSRGAWNPAAAKGRANCRLGMKRDAALQPADVAENRAAQAVVNPE